MSVPRAPDPVKLVIGAVVSEKALLEQVAPELESLFGPLDILSAWMAFDQTDYYAKEMGPVLWRRMMAFKRLVDPGRLAAVKLATNEIEAQWTADGRRRVNLDPGILSRERFVLATGKNFSHRIYLSDGIWADLTLVFCHGGYDPLPWTYPDYAAPEMRALLAMIREKYRVDLKAAPAGAASNGDEP
ncbi:MAG: DUF4416 family protein [Desulfobacterales bacterium]|jgi:hypothetical protein|nr:DUF4416 family protein [Desulfobacteraceae bacterium]MDY0311810.1 DUF4416 family protein [Desulfobacterales bacterium]